VLSVCLHVLSFQLLNASNKLYESWYIVYHVTEPVSTESFINPSHQSLFLYMYSHIVTRQDLGNNFNTAMNKQATMDELLD
jgi:hypothetical protein